MEINHFSHEHPLALSEERLSKSIRCNVCRESIFGLSYCCLSCPFVLHKWCAELPRELSCTLDLHQKVLLGHKTLILSRVEVSEFPDCRACKTEISPLGFAYSTTNEFLPTEFFHVDCVFFPVELLSRSEQMFLYRKESCCTVCQITDTVPKVIELGVTKSYRHIQCIMLPHKVKHSVHLHELTLHPRLVEEEWYFEFFCDACEKGRDPAFPIYYCEPCKFVAHIGCGIFGSDHPLVQNIIGTHPLYEIESSQSTEKEEAAEEEDDVYEEEDKIKHFSHKHPLALKNITRTSNHVTDLCGGCQQNIFGMTYACVDERCESECFYLHKWCAELPKMIRCSAHPHHGSLKLMKVPQSRSSDDEDDEIDYEDVLDNYICGFCGMETELIIYRCDKCNFQIHGLCALLPDDLNHESHEHTLNAVFNNNKLHKYVEDELEIPLGSSKNPICQACGFLCKNVSLECKTCDFHLHVHCFLLPKTAKHTTHRHDLRLTYSYKEDPTALEYYCDTCEKPRTPNRWVYCCPEPKCYIVSHVDCAVAKHFTTVKAMQLV